MLVCRRCGASEFIETRVGVLVNAAGKPVGGQKALICLHCMVRRAERVEAG
jgi:ribosomal protein L40E